MTIDEGRGKKGGGSYRKKRFKLMKMVIDENGDAHFITLQHSYSGTSNLLSRM